MTEILFIKTSSLGDVIHNMPAVTDVRARYPHARIHWLVEEAYAPLVALHPAVNEVLPVAWRRWRHSLYAPAVWREIAARFGAARKRRYDAVIDTQGLLRTGVSTRLLHGPRHGYDRASIREPLASFFYDVRHRVSRERHAIDRNRALSGLALGYAPQGGPDYGLDRNKLRDNSAAPYAVLLHASARAEKQWPTANWSALGAVLETRGVELVLPWGNDSERENARSIANALVRARVPENMPLDKMARLIAGAKFVVGVDTGLLHLAAALGVPLVGIFAASSPELTGPVGAGGIEIVGGKGSPPSVRDVSAALDRIAL